MFSKAIELKNVGKCYPIYDSPIDRLKELIFRKRFHREFWALRDVTLSVEKGETLGIIGENGAGKSTLLKIIAGTLTPTTGEVNISGRVSAILELGMGFHPEMTGLENIFLSGSLMGLSKKEIERKLNDIIEFSELGDFINQPVKTYSSGMYVRLAFSIAVSVDPDILVVDEALSVGDSYFQKKSLDRILEFKNSGKTIVFCSHNTYHITHLCSRAVWLDHGRVREEGNVFNVVASYEEFTREKSKKVERKMEDYHPLVEITYVKLNKTSYLLGESLEAAIGFRNPEGLPFHIGVAIGREDGTLCFGTSTYHDGVKPIKDREGLVKFVIPKLPIMGGKYEFLAAAIDDTANLTYHARSAEFRVLKKEKELGLLWIEHKWDLTTCAL